jgi:hypothetical protein
MAKEKIIIAADEAAFPTTITGFLLGVKQPEMKRAFQDLMKKEGIVGHKAPAEWQRLYDLFQRKPVSVPWQVWQESNKEVANP